MDRMNVQSNTASLLLAPALLVAIAACGSGGGLSKEEVQNIPPGTAVGTAASGRYDLELYTVACSGQCQVRNNGLTGSACDVGNVDTASVQVTFEIE